MARNINKQDTIYKKLFESDKTNETLHLRFLINHKIAISKYLQFTFSHHVNLNIIIAKLIIKLN